MSERVVSSEAASSKIAGSRIIPSLRYKDAHAAIEWLVRVFGFAKQAVYDGPNGTVAHAQLTLGGGMIMLGSASNQSASTQHSVDLAETGGRETVGLCIIVSDEECEAIYTRVQTEGMEILVEFAAQSFGGHAFTCRDLEGHVWWIGSYDPWAEYKGPSAEGTA